MDNPKDYTVVVFMPCSPLAEQGSSRKLHLEIVGGCALRHGGACKRLACIHLVPLSEDLGLIQLGGT